MEKKPILLRLIIAFVVILIFALSINPLTPQDFYVTMGSLLKNKQDAAYPELVEKAKAYQESTQLYPSEALLAVADNSGVELKDMIKGDNIQDNRDAIAAIRKAASSSIRLGLDLNGGVEFVLQMIPDKQFAEEYEKNPEAARDRAIEILRRRLESQKIYEAEIAPMNEFISLKAPIVSKDEKVKLRNLIEMSAKLRFRLVHPESQAEVGKYLSNPRNYVPPVGYEIMQEVTARKGEKGDYFLVEIRPQMDGSNVERAQVVSDQYGMRKISLEFNSTGAKDFSRVTSNNVSRQLAIVLDGKLYCAPNIREAITGGMASIDGKFAREDAENIANALSSGNLPFQIKIASVFDTAPSLGLDNVKNGIYAGILALITVMVFMLVYYLAAGFTAVVALAVNIVLVLGAMAAFSGTLTLPGIAGIILTIGMAVDANVLIFERIREELNSGKSLFNAIELGYSRAFTAVFDANITTLFIALILLNVGSGAVKGFALTLGIGIATSMFTALFLTRLLLDIFAQVFKLQKLVMCHWLSAPNIHFLKVSRWAVLVSGVMIVVSLSVFAVRGHSLLGVDFTGGTVVSMDYKEVIPQKQLEDLLRKNGFSDVRVSYKTSASTVDNKKLELMVRGDVIKPELGNKVTKESPKDQIMALLQNEYPQAGFSGEDEMSIGGLVGKEFTRNAIYAVILSFISIVLYVSLRYEFSYAMAAIIALLHDLIIVMGIYALMGREISLNVVAAILTIIGYSINDTIVVFDRIRENARLLVDTPYRSIIDLSLNQTLSRTILTSLTTLMVLVILAIFGGIAVNDFVIVMLFGVIVGTYSSLFIASPIISVWHRKIGNLTGQQKISHAAEPVEAE